MAAAFHEQPDLERIYLAADGSLKALYRDNSLLLLSSNGASFTRVSTTGAKTVQLTGCCLNRWKLLVAELLAFRNQHLDVPCFPAWLQEQLQDQHGFLFVTGYPITDTVWPATAEEAAEGDLVQLLGNNTVQVFSSCGSAYIQLQHTGLRFVVCYPLLLSHDSSSNTYRYIQHTQTFSRNQYPRRWQHALKVAVAAAELAAHSDAQHRQQQWPTAQVQQLQQQLQDPVCQLLDAINNTPNPQPPVHSPTGRSSCAAAVQQPSTTVNPEAAAAARHGFYSSSHGRCSSPLQRPHRPWQPDWSLQQQHAVTPASVSAAGAAAAAATGRRGQWCPPGSPGSPSAALYARAEQQQEQQQVWELGRYSPGAVGPVQAPRLDNSCLQCVVQLPIMPAVLKALPPHCQQQKQQQQLEGSEANCSSSSSGEGGGWNSHVAAALAEALGQRQQSSSSSSGGSVGSWWLEPHLLLPSDELLHMVWCSEATFIFVEDVAEVEVWVHRDDSCLFTFQSGAFLTHLHPAAPAAAAAADAAMTVPGPVADAAAAAAAAGNAGDTGCWPLSQPQLSGNEGLLDGCIDACEVSRVYAASTLPVDLMVPAGGNSSSSSRWSVPQVPLGRIAFEALKLRSTMARVKAWLLTTSATQQGPAAAAAAGMLATAYKALQPHQRRQQQSSTGLVLAAHHHKPALPQPHQPQQQQQQLSLEVVEQQEVPDVGRFTAYADGRVRVLFSDRTILGLDAQRLVAQLTLPDGSRQEVPTSRPVGVEEYVQAALEFASWSSCTPIQRAAALRMQALVAAELRRSARMAAICEWGANPGRVPAAAAALEATGAGAVAEAPPLLLSHLPAAAGPAHGGGGVCLLEGGGHPLDVADALPAGAACSVEEMLAANQRLLQRL